jgi:exosortase
MSNNPNEVEAGPTRPGGSLVDMLGASESRPISQTFSGSAYIKIAVITFLFCGLTFFHLKSFVAQWIGNANWSHGFLIPLFSAYLIYTRWDQLIAARRRACFWGLPIFLLSLTSMMFCFHRGEPWLSQLSMIPLLIGIVLYLGGPSVLRITWVPILYLILAIPVRPMVYDAIAGPLQNLAASSTEIILTFCNVKIDVIDSNMLITSISGKEYPLQVVEACSGVRSLMAFVALSAAMAYIDDRPVWQRLVLIGSSLPITVLCNILRVTTTSTMFVIDQPELGKDFMHTFMGMALLVPALLMLLGLSWMMNHLFVEVDEDEEDDDADNVSEAVSSGADNPQGAQS